MKDTFGLVIDRPQQDVMELFDSQENRVKQQPEFLGMEQVSDTPDTGFHSSGWMRVMAMCMKKLASNNPKNS